MILDANLDINEVFGNSLRKPIPDRELIYLKDKPEEMKRGLTESRFDFLRRSQGEPVMESIRFDRDLSNEEAKHREAICRNYLTLFLDVKKGKGETLNRDDLLMFYRTFTKGFGLSRLEAEELAPYSEEWLTICLDQLSSSVPPSTNANAT